jgi:hypothetical protein
MVAAEQAALRADTPEDEESTDGGGSQLPRAEP